MTPLDRNEFGVLLSEVTPKPVQWLWPGYIPLGKLCMLDGDPGVGKSVLSLDLAARVTTDGVMPDGSAGPTGGVVLAIAEDGLADTVRPRLEAAGANLERIREISLFEFNEPEEWLDLSKSFERLERTIQKMGAKLAILDPLMSFIGKNNENKSEQHMRAVLAPLREMAERLQVSVLPLRHLNKDESKALLYRGGGSIGITALCRAAFIVVKDENQGCVVLQQLKANLAPPAAPLKYIVKGHSSGVPIVEWLGEATTASSSPREDSLRPKQEAILLLKIRLADGPVLSRVLENEARKLGISERHSEASQRTCRRRSFSD